MKLFFLNGDVPNQQDGYHLLTRDILALLAQQYDVHLVCFKGQNVDQFSMTVPLKSFENQMAEGDSFKRIRQLCSVFSKKTMIEWQFKNLNIEKINDRLEKEQPDVVFFNHIRSAWISPYLRKNKKTKYVYLAHNCETVAYDSIAQLQQKNWKKAIAKQESQKVALLEKKILAHMDYCIVLTEEDKKRLLAFDSTPTYIVIPPSIDFSQEEGKKEEESETQLLLIGSYKWDPKKKNALWLMNEVFPLVKKENEDVCLSIVGAGANKLKASNHDKERIQIYSDVASTKPYLQGDAIFIIPERQLGGFKLKAIEAANAGLAIVSTRAGIEGTRLIDGESCLLAETKEEFAKQITYLLQDNSYRRQLGERAKKTVHQAFQKKVIQQAYVHFFQDLVADNHPLLEPSIK